MLSWFLSGLSREVSEGPKCPLIPPHAKLVTWSPISDAVITVAATLTKNFTQNLPTMVTDSIYQLHMTIMHQKKSKTFDFHHVEGYQDPSPWARE